jgi:hypothetical protein
LGEFAWSKDEFEPFRATPLCAKFTAPQKIALGNDTNELAFLADDGQTADLMLQHQTRGIDDSLVRANVNDFGRHDVFGSHCLSLNLEVAKRASALLLRIQFAPGRVQKHLPLSARVGASLVSCLRPCACKRYGVQARIHQPWHHWPFWHSNGLPPAPIPQAHVAVACLPSPQAAILCLCPLA